MQLQFIKNIQFTRLIKTDGRLREFNFRKSNGDRETSFTVDVSDDRGNRIIFRMQKAEGGWRIVPQPLPEWVKEKETVFNDLIEEELSQS